MKFTIDAKSLAAGLSAVGKTVERRNTIPVLSNAVIESRNDGITIKATDLDMEMTVGLSADVIEPGVTTIPAHLAQDIVKKISGEVTFSLTPGEQQATISSGRSRFRLMTLPVEDFPSLSAGDFTHSFAMTGDALSGILRDLQFAISTEETRYYLNGVYLHHMEGGLLRAVATDGHRMARAEIPAPDGSEGMPGIIVPRKTVTEAISIGDSAKGEDVRIDVSDTKIRFTHGSTVLTSKLIDGTFPDYQRVIPTGNNIIANIDSKTLADASDRVATISSKRGRAVKLTFSNGSLSLSVSNPENGSAEDQIDADYDADPLDIGFNAAYLKDVLKTLGNGETRIALADGGSPTVFTNEKNPGLLLLLMPMRI